MTDELKTVLQNLVLKQKIGGLLGVTIIDNLGNDWHNSRAPKLGSWVIFEEYMQGFI